MSSCGALSLANVDLEQPLADHPLNRGRVAWWLTLPGRFGGPVWWDLVVERAAVLSGGNGWITQSHPGGAGSLSCNAGYASATPSQQQLLNQGFTTGAWFCANSIAGKNYSTILSVDSNSEWNGWLLGFQSTSSKFGITSPDISSIAYTSDALNLSTWYRGIVAVGYGTSTTVCIYLNGKLAQTVNNAVNQISMSNPLFYIGADGGAGAPLPSSCKWSGFLNDIFIVDGVWDANLVALDYRLSQQRYPGVLRRRKRVFYSVLPGAGATVYLTPGGFGTATPRVLPSAGATTAAILPAAASAVTAPPATNAGATADALPASAATPPQRPVVSAGASVAALPAVAATDAVPPVAFAGAIIEVHPAPAALALYIGPTTQQAAAKVDVAPGQIACAPGLPQGQAGATIAIASSGFGASSADAETSAGANAEAGNIFTALASPAVAVSAGGVAVAYALPAGLVAAAAAVQAFGWTDTPGVLFVEPSRPVFFVEPSRPVLFSTITTGETS